MRISFSIYMAERRHHGRQDAWLADMDNDIPRDGESYK